MEENEAVELAIAELNKYIKLNRMRHTQERETILKTIYSMKDKVSIEEILKRHEEIYPHIHICRSTVYNCVRLLLEINVINEMKDKNNTVYGKTFGNQDKVELVCKRCRKSKLISVSHIGTLMTHLGCSDFKVQHYRLTLFGICASCKLHEFETVKSLE